MIRQVVQLFALLQIEGVIFNMQSFVNFVLRLLLQLRQAAAALQLCLLNFRVLLIYLLLMMLKLVPILFVMVSKLLAEEEFDRGVLAELLWALPRPVEVAARARRLLVLQKVVHRRAILN